MKVFLGGTCNESTWRDELIPQLIENNIEFFNPVVEDWNDKAQEQELIERKSCDICLYTITPKMSGIYSIAEVVDDSNKHPDKTILIILKEDGDITFDNGQWKSLEALGKMVENNNSSVFTDFKSAISHMKTLQITEADDTKEEENNIIGDVVHVMFSNFHTNPIKALVDSGATISSLHVDKFQVKGNQISFISKMLSDNIITMPIETWQSVSTADNGVENRPIIKLNITINDTIIDGAMFNLNDRSKMKYPILIGQNILEKTDFLIDPKINDDGDIKQEIR